MKNIQKLALTLSAVAAITASATAQFVDGSMSALNLRINSTDPSSVMNHVINVAAGGNITLSLTENMGGNVGFILLATGGLQAAAIPAGPIVDQLDLAGLSLSSVVLDGFNPGSGLGSATLNSFAVTPFSVGFALPLGFAGTTPLAFQALYLDPTGGPFFFRSTDAGAISFGTSFCTTYALPDDGFGIHTLLPTTPPIQYGGVNYTQFVIESNGVIKFSTTGDGDFTPTMARLFNGFGGTGPGVAYYYADINRPGTPVGTPLFKVTEDLVSGDVTLAGINQNYWNSQTATGPFSVTFDSVSHDVTIDLTGNLVSTNAADPRLIGFSDGTVGGLDVTHAAPGWSGLGGTFNAAGSNTSVGFLYAASAPLGFNTLVATDMGTFDWTISIM